MLNAACFIILGAKLGITSVMVIGIIIAVISFIKTIIDFITRINK